MHIFNIWEKKPLRLTFLYMLNTCVKWEPAWQTKTSVTVYDEYHDIRYYTSTMNSKDGRGRLIYEKSNSNDN